MSSYMQDAGPTFNPSRTIVTLVADLGASSEGCCYSVDLAFHIIQKSWEKFRLKISFIICRRNDFSFP